MRMLGWLGSLAVLGLIVAVSVGDEEKIPLAKLPDKVTAAVKAKFPDAELLGASTEKENGELVYEVSLKYKGHHYDVTLKPDGTITDIEKTIAAKDLPKAVAKALEDKYPKATYKIVEEIFKVEKKEEKLAYYEVLLVTAEKQALEVQVTAEGKIINEEKKGSDKDDK